MIESEFVAIELIAPLQFIIGLVPSPINFY